MLTLPQPSGWHIAVELCLSVRTQTRVSHGCMWACIHMLVFGILEFDAHIHMMARDTHMRVPDIRMCHGDNFLLVSSLSPQFELKMYKVTEHVKGSIVLPMRRALRIPIAIPGAMVAIIGTVVVAAGSVVTPVVPVVTPVTAPELNICVN